MTTKQILITGGAGYIGSHAVLAFKQRGWQPVVVDNLVTGRRALVPKDVPLMEADIGDMSAMPAILAQVKPQAIVHFAGSIVVPESVRDPAKYYNNNTAATWRLIQAAAAAEVKAFLFSSTAAVYGDAAVVPIPETAALMPINPYGRSKLASEFMLRDFAAASGFLSGVLRYFNVAGADPEGRTGQATPEATHLIKVAAEVVSGKRAGMQLFGDDYPTPDGTCVRDYIHVSDLADAHVSVLEYMLLGNQHALFNCGYGMGYSVREVVESVRRVSGHAVPAALAPRRAGDPPQLVADNTALRSALGWAPKHANLDHIVKTALSWEARQDTIIGTHHHAA